MPDVTAVSIANMALSHLGAASTIESFDELSNEAVQCKLWYDIARKEVLEAFDWSFARKRATLAEHADGPPDEWAFRYQYPADCIMARSIWNAFGGIGVFGLVDATRLSIYQGDVIPFELEASDAGDDLTILTNMEDAILVYTFDQAVPAMFSSHFVKILARNLAAKMAYSITGKQALEDEHFKIAERLIRLAPAYDGNQHGITPPAEATWIRGR